MRRAFALFFGGEGGTLDEASVRRRLGAQLTPDMLSDQSPDGDPHLSDIVWWKGDHVAVVEVSLVVDEDDVMRAHARAETLRRTGMPITAMILGNAWDSLETRARAEALRLGWKVGNDVSEGFIAFRRLPALPTALPTDRSRSPGE